MTMDYQRCYCHKGEQEWEKLWKKEKLDQRLERMSPQYDENTSRIAQSLNDINKFVPLGICIFNLDFFIHKKLYIKNKEQKWQNNNKTNISDV